MPDERRRSFARVFDSLDIVSKRGLPFRPLACEFRIAFDDRQKIVEVVRDSSRQSSHGLHAAGLLRLHLHQLSFADVHHEPFHDRVIFAALRNCRRIADPNRASIFSRNAILRLERFTTQAGQLCFVDGGVVVWVHKLQPVFRCLQPLFRRIAQNRFNLRTDVVPAAVHSGFGNVADRRYLFHNHSILDFCLGARVFRLPAFRQVAAQQYHPALGQCRDRQFDRDAHAGLPRNIHDAIPLAVLAQCRSNFVRRRSLHISHGHSFPPAANHHFSAGVAQHLGIASVNIGVLSLRIHDRHAVHSGVQSPRLLPHQLCITRLAVVADRHARDVTND